MKRTTYFEIVENRIVQLNEYIVILKKQEQMFLNSKNKKRVEEIKREIEKAENNIFLMYNEYCSL